METKPGVSGKDESGTSWFNENNYQKQRDQLLDDDESELGFSQSTGQNLVGRTDLKNQEVQTSGGAEGQIIEALKRSPEVDISQVRVSFETATVILSGMVSSVKEERAIVSIVENLPTVERVVNRLRLRANEF